MHVPNCVGIILDGNRRWAKERGLPKLEGHRAGFEKLGECVRWVRDRGIPHLAVFVFSTENWNREKEEVDYLMDLFLEMAEKKFESLGKEKARVRFIGKLDMLPKKLQEAIGRIESETLTNSAITLWICMSYGGRAEITAAAAALSQSGKEITEEALRAHFWSAEMPDPDIIIRTSGEQRLSNFLTWQSAYSELFFVKPHWPDFSEEILGDVLSEFGERERRHGK